MKEVAFYTVITFKNIDERLEFMRLVKMDEDKKYIDGAKLMEEIRSKQL